MYIQAKRYKMFHVEHFFDFAAQPPSFRSTGADEGVRLYVVLAPVYTLNSTTVAPAPPSF